MHARLKGVVHSCLPTTPPRVPRSDSAAADRLATRAAVRSRPRVSERANAAVYPVRRAGEYAAPPRSRASRLR
jgi:hypothetical protein